MADPVASSVLIFPVFRYADEPAGAVSLVRLDGYSPDGDASVEVLHWSVWAQSSEGERFIPLDKRGRLNDRCPPGADIDAWLNRSDEQRWPQTLDMTNIRVDIDPLTGNVRNVEMGQPIRVLKGGRVCLTHEVPVTAPSALPVLGVVSASVTVDGVRRQVHGTFAWIAPAQSRFFQQDGVLPDWEHRDRK